MFWISKERNSDDLGRIGLLSNWKLVINAFTSIRASRHGGSLNLTLLFHVKTICKEIRLCLPITSSPSLAVHDSALARNRKCIVQERIFVVAAIYIHSVVVALNLVGGLQRGLYLYIC